MWVFFFLLTLNNCVLIACSQSRPHTLRAPFHETCPTSDANCKEVSSQITHTSLQLGYKSQDPITPYLGLIVCYNGPQNSGKHLFTVKDTNEQVDEELYRVRSQIVPRARASIPADFGVIKHT